MEIHLIWAQDENGGIGKDGKLPWYIPEDLKKFKELTLDSTIVMGRKTWESLPLKPLPKRQNIVLSKTQNYDTVMCSSLGECMEYLDTQNISKVFIIGGRSIYKLFFQHADFLHITKIHSTINDINEYFPIDSDIIHSDFKKIKNKKLSKKATYTLWNRAYQNSI
tara:strand:+ start:683 stop:1177 length:495 start_codon:yes stop_codon:yes gene_type:complete